MEKEATSTQDLIKQLEKKLKQHEADLKKNPKSLFLKGLVKTTKEHIEELKNKNQ